VLSVSASGISSAGELFIAPPDGADVTLRLDPNDSSQLQVLSDGSVTGSFALSSFSSIDVLGSGLPFQVNFEGLGTTPLGALTIDAQGGIINLAGSVSSSGDVTFNGPVLLSGDVSISSTGNITFNGTVDGPQQLTLSAGGSVSLGAAGSMVPVAGLTVAQAQQVNLGSVLKGRTVKLTGVRSFTFNGLGGNDTMTVDGSGGVPLFAGNVRFDGGAGIDSLIVNAAGGKVSTGSGTVVLRPATGTSKQTITYAHTETTSVGHAAPRARTAALFRPSSPASGDTLENPLSVKMGVGERRFLL
jgi:hypothetical protein